MSRIRTPENYPADWGEIAAFIKAANHYECQECGRQCTKPGEPYAGGQWVLTVAHYEHDYMGPEIFVAALCAGCHLRHDAKASWLLRQRLARYRQARAGQLTFFWLGYVS